MLATVATESAAEPGIDVELKSDIAAAKAPFDDGTSDAVVAEPAPSAPADVETELPAFERDAKPDAPPERGTEHPRSDLLRQLDQAPLRLRCFGARGVWLGERQVWPSYEAVEDTGWELVVLLGIYPVASIQAETLATRLRPTRRRSRCTVATCSTASPCQPIHGCMTALASPPRFGPTTTASGRKCGSGWPTPRGRNY
jgi:hypothetical protein